VSGTGRVPEARDSCLRCMAAKNVSYIRLEAQVLRRVDGPGSHGSKTATGVLPRSRVS
jgi:hypothetical protein